MQRVSSQARAAELHSTDLQAELRHQQEVAEERDAEIRRLQKVSKLAQPFGSVRLRDSTDAVSTPCADSVLVHVMHIHAVYRQCHHMLQLCLYLLSLCNVNKISENAVIMRDRDNTLLCADLGLTQVL